MSFQDFFRNALLRRFRPLGILFLATVAAVTLSHSALAQVVDYDIVYVRAPRFGDTTLVQIPEVSNPVGTEPGSDLVLLKPNGTEEVLFAAGNGAVLDPAVSFDAKFVYFSYIPDLRSSALNPQRQNLPRGGADIYKIDLTKTPRTAVKLTSQTWAPPKGAAKWSSDHLTASSADAFYLGYGIFNLAPCPLPGGKIMFVSNRDGYVPVKGLTTLNLRLYIMDEDGRNVEKVGHLNFGSAMHPTVLMDGRVVFSTLESQGNRDGRGWALWTIRPDGTRWEPMVSAFEEGGAFHFQGQLSDGRMAFAQYYNVNNNGFGTVLAIKANPDPAKPPFGSADPNSPTNPPIKWGPRKWQYRFSPQGLENLTAFAHPEDTPSDRLPSGALAGKATHPTGAPNNDLMLVWTPGPANQRPSLQTPAYDAGIYLLKGGVPVDDPSKLVKVKNDPRYNEIQPRPVVPYSRIYGIAEPAKLPYLPNDGTQSTTLPAGTPFGLVGTASFYRRDTTPGASAPGFDGLDKFNTAENGSSYNWEFQGADAGKYTNADIHAVRIVAMESVAHRSYGPAQGAAFYMHGGDRDGLRPLSNGERLRVLGEIPLRKTDAGGAVVRDPWGDPDTSVLVKIPADTPFTFQTIDKNGMTLNMGQTWHQVRPGERRVDCGGCHAHAQLGADFTQTAAGKPGYTVTDLTKSTPILTTGGAVKNHSKRVYDVEYYRDIKPILQNKCISCHSGASPAGNLKLDDASVVNGFENTYNRLAFDKDAQYGHKPLIGSWRQTNMSRYIRAFQARRSLLIWKIYGQRLDGWTNADHPSETSPGSGVLDRGTDRNAADIDYTGSQMPPAGSPQLTDDEKMMIARWVDLGAPISSPDAALSKYGFFSDEMKPALTVSLPAAGVNAQALSTIRFGAFDSQSGLNRASLSVIATFPVNGRAAGAELASLFTETDHVWTLNLTTPVTSLGNGKITFKVADVQGNEQVMERSFSIGNAPPLDPLADDDSDGIPNQQELQLGTNPLVKDNDIFANTDFGRRLFVQQMFRDVMGREARVDEVEPRVTQLTQGTKTRADLLNELILIPANTDISGPVIRLYSAYFLRSPDMGGLSFWEIKYGSGEWTFFGISDFFAISAEFQQRYGALNNSQFVDLIYRNVLGRAPDASGKAFWEAELNSGRRTRGSVMAAFSEAPENKTLKDADVRVTMVYADLLRRSPDAAELANWTGRLKAGTANSVMIDSILASVEYRKRFLP